MKKYIFPAIVVILILMLVCSILPTPNPKRCAICDSIPHHAPALVNLATGEVGELVVYEPHPIKGGELNEYQQGGTFSFIYVAGLHGYQDTSTWETHISVPVNENEYEEKFFCKSCRELLLDCTDLGYILADLKNAADPIVYEIKEDLNISFRCYDIFVKESEENEKFEISVIGSLPLQSGYIHALN